MAKGPVRLVREVPTRRSRGVAWTWPTAGSSARAARSQPSAPAREAGRTTRGEHRTPDDVAASERVAELERKIGQQALELDFFARALRHVKASAPPSDGR